LGKLGRPSLDGEILDRKAEVTVLGAGTPEGYRKRIEEGLARLEAIHDSDDQHQAMVISDLLVTVIGLKLLQLADRDADWVHQLPNLWRQIGQAIADRPVALARYQARMELAFWAGNRDDWFNGCLKRTALEFVRTDIEPNSQPFLDTQDLDDFDSELPDVAKRRAPLPPEMIPANMPDDHWWWSIPSGGPEDDYEDY